MSGLGTPTFDQLRTFQTVMAEGSFTSAGRRLNRAVSVISYCIANLEAQLSVILFEREGTRCTELTEAGRPVLAEARSVSSGIDGLKAKVIGLLDGPEAEVNFAVDVIFLARRLGEVLRAFVATYPTVTLRLHVEALAGVAAHVLDGRAAIRLSGPLAAGIDGIGSVAAGSVPMTPVAAADHPLACYKSIPTGAGREHVQHDLTDRSPLTEGRDFAVPSPRTGRLAYLGAKHQLLREGIGWMNMPLPLIEPNLIAGTLKRLMMPDDPGGVYRLSGIWRRGRPPGTAASSLLNQLVERAQEDVDLAGAADL
jgi:DNA-binding transcriptional LysR family regulator